ncbi:substrate-binding periplasmic protein [Aestuariirhabdus sp. LZHN29]|uniref:substrate-binding periplasmic protein n=1 Tax=Aestuariirhabdus sp. LZHN29 TaxID=3417462 RepID=UPI003CEA5516
MYRRGFYGGGWIALLWSLLYAGNCVSAEVTLGVRTSIAPWAIEASDRGIELDIVRQALAYRGHSLKPVYLPFTRLKQQLETGAIDGVLLSIESLGLEGVYWSDSHVVFQNVAVTLAEHGFELGNVESLASRSLSIVAFPNARVLLGPAFSNAVDEADTYQEITNQFSQVRMLYRKRVELIVLERSIFEYYSQQARRAGDTLSEVTIYPLFKPIHYKVSFRYPGIRDDFNAGLQALRDSGHYQKIVDSYLKP